MCACTCFCFLEPARFALGFFKAENTKKVGCGFSCYHSRFVLLTTNPKRVNLASMTQKQRGRCEAESRGGSAETEVRNRIIAKKRCRVQERRSLRSAWPWHRWHGLPGKLQFRSYNTRSRLENLELRHRAQRESERASSVDRSTSNSPAAARGERGSKRGTEGSREKSGTNTTDWVPATIRCHLHPVLGLAWRRRLRPLTMLETRRA